MAIRRAGPYTTLYTVTADPGSGWTTVPVSGLSSYRYLRYRGGGGSYTNVAEIIFSHNGAAITGTDFGTNGSQGNDGDNMLDVFDGNTNTFFDGPDSSGDYVGIDSQPNLTSLGSQQTLLQNSITALNNY